MVQWLWQLRVWWYLTGHPLHLRAVAVASALQGRAQRVARNIDFPNLTRDNGLQMLIFMLEQAFGPEEQAVHEEKMQRWERCHRPQGGDMQLFLADFDDSLHNAQEEGLQINDLGLTRELFKKANLSEDDSRWVLFPVQGNLWRYQEIRAALRTLPHCLTKMHKN